MAMITRSVQYLREHVVLLVVFSLIAGMLVVAGSVTLREQPPPVSALSLRR